MKLRMSTKKATPLEIKQVGNTKFMLVVLSEKIAIHSELYFMRLCKTAGIRDMIKETLALPWISRA